uniref:Putative zinc-or iron-chelating protein n=1 Tax=viral metagenome TaxID=1070528 RepID=A0A6M3M1V3_9ZZZZ
MSDMEGGPFNPKIYETFREFLKRQKEKIPRYPVGTEFKCIQCGECCTWHYFEANIEPNIREKLLEYSTHPHGLWMLRPYGMSIDIYQLDPGSMKKENRPWFGDLISAIPIHFSAELPEDHLEYLRVTGRMHGYWVLDDLLVIYSPTVCRHLVDGVVCAIYEKRPKVCQDYCCWRYPVVRSDSVRVEAKR